MTVQTQEHVLVTGAGGALAQLVVARLLAAGKSVVAVDFRSVPDLGPQVPTYRADLTKRAFRDVFSKHLITGVIHLGRMGADEYDRQSRYNANVLGTQKLLDLCHEHGITRTVVLSTFYVYGAHAYNPAMLDENAPLKASGLTLDLVDSVELENLAGLYLWKHRELNITILRPCHIVGPGVRNSMSLLLSRQVAPVLLGFSPMMQFIHVNDMANAVVTCFNRNHPGIFNVAPDDWIPYQEALQQSGCRKLPLPSIPPLLPNQISKLLKWKAFPSYLINYFKYPVIINGEAFRKTFDFRCQKSLGEIFTHYRNKKDQHY